jgi:ABC-type sugar transport system ATPase subunit
VTTSGAHRSRRDLVEVTLEVEQCANLVVDRHVVETAVGRLTTIGPVEDTQVAAVVRPESLQVTADPAGRGAVTGIEYFGHDQLVHVRFDDGTTVRARRGPILDLHRGDRVDVRVICPVVVFPADDAAR